MAAPPESRPRIDDPEFARAVALIDAGDVARLETLLRSNPALLTAVAEEDGSFAGEYFKAPRLLWFIAENPIRNGTLPATIVSVASVIIEASRDHSVEDLRAQLDYTLSLVCSGCVPRECGVQDPLVQALVAAGADANAALPSALAHREAGAARVLLDVGALPTLASTAGLADVTAMESSFADAGTDERQAALAVAAINGQATAARILVDRGVDPNRFAPAAFGSHATPLHHAISANAVTTVMTLVTRGADLTTKDKAFGGDAVGWAEHFGHREIAEFLAQAKSFMPAVRAVRSGDVGELRRWLSAHPTRINDRLGDNPRTLLHYATDWPGNWPRAGESIRLLVAAGADVNAVLTGADNPSPETPLHWAASSDDLDAANALLDAGADVDACGGCIANATPLFLAVVFRKWAVANRLVDAGAAFDLPLCAGLGRLQLVRTFFTSSGEFHNPYRDVPYRDSHSDAVGEVNLGLFAAAGGGRLAVARYLVERGADVNAIGPTGVTPMDEASRDTRAIEVAAYLRSQGALRVNEL